MVSSRTLLRNRLEDFGIKMCYIRAVNPLIPPTSSTLHFVDIYISWAYFAYTYVSFLPPRTA